MRHTNLGLVLIEMFVIDYSPKINQNLSINFCSQSERPQSMKTAEFYCWLLLSFASWSKIKKVMMMQYASCVIIAQKVQTAVYKYKS